MANPNIANLSSIYGKTSFLKKGIATNNAVPSSEVGTHNLLANASSSGKIFKLNSLFVSLIYNDFSGLQYGGLSTSRVANSIVLPKYTILLNNGSTDHILINDRPIAENDDVLYDIGLTKDHGIYLQEGETLKFLSSTNNTYYNSTENLVYYGQYQSKKQYTFGFNLSISYEEIS